MKNPQRTFQDERFKEKLSFGGSLLRKSANRHARPVSSKETMHVILKSSKAKGRYSFRNGVNATKVHRLVTGECARYGVKLIKWSNNFNHLHLHTKFPSRAIYLKFIRSLTAKLAMAITGANKTQTLKSIFGSNGFWDARPFTRIVRGLRGFKIANDYIQLNQLEAEGLAPRRIKRLASRTSTG